MSRFYIGQEVVALVNASNSKVRGRLTKGNHYFVETLKTECCGKEVGIGVRGVSFNHHSWYCRYCNKCINNHLVTFSEKEFAPLEEITAEENMVIEEVNEILNPETVTA